MLYKLPKTIKEFDLDKYYHFPSEPIRLIHQDWPIMRSEGEKQKIKKIIEQTEKSVSLCILEKLQIFDHQLSDFQINALLDVFEDEQFEFKEMLKNERQTIYESVRRTSDDWKWEILPMVLLGRFHPRVSSDLDKMKRNCKKRHNKSCEKCSMMERMHE